jgi:DNA helicase-2/ATP-dependent DNA helicase PcrA
MTNLAVEQQLQPMLNDQLEVLSLLCGGSILLDVEITVLSRVLRLCKLLGDEPPPRLVEPELVDLLISQKLIEVMEEAADGLAYCVSVDGRRWVRTRRGISLSRDRIQNASSFELANALVESANPLPFRSAETIANPVETIAPPVETAAPTVRTEQLTPAPAKSNGFTPSPYQEKIFSFIRSEGGDGIVNAVAGSGKTTTLVKSAGLIRGGGLFCAFNKHIAESLASKLSGTGMVAKTIHALGYGVVGQNLRKPRINDGKYTKIVNDYVRDHRKEFAEDGQARQNIRKLVNFARLTLTPLEPTALEQMADRYNLEFADNYPEPVKQILWTGDQLAESSGEIDFTDMLWIPHRMNLSPRTSPWVLVDECQDLNAAQLDLVRKLRATGGRMMFVGDRRQAIMAFAGADSKSYDIIRDTLGAKEMPLSTCYRCPTSHIALAKALVPQIEAAPGAIEGEVIRENEENLPQLVQEGDLILCRRNAPLIKHCLRLIQQRRPARIRGRDVGKELADLIRSIGDNGKDFRKFPEGVDLWHQKQFESLTSRDAPESAFELIDDKTEALHACYTGFPCNSAHELAAEIEKIFSDAGGASIWLSSVHRAKGLEENRVFILQYGTLGQFGPKQSPDEYQQELNLKYVALTRARHTLYLM